MFFNRVFAEVSHPSAWALNFLKTLHKKGSVLDPDNYRGIAIGSCITKLFSIILLSRLERYIEGKNLISPNQIGFQKGHRTADHIFVLSTIINKIVKIEKKKLYTAFIDFRKAYDRINRTLLFLKLQNMGIKGLFYENIKRLHDSTAYMIKVKGGYTNPINSHLGLLQGGILSPKLFNLYIDDITDIFDEHCDPVDLQNETISHLLYADDLIIFSKTEMGLKHSLQNLEDYCREWQLGINVTKSKILIFNSTGRKLKSDQFRLQGNPLEVADSYCYLGIIFFPSGSFRHAPKKLREKAQKAMFPLYSIISQFQILPSHSLNLFQSFVKPIALYNAENWAVLSEHQIKSIETRKNSLLSYIIDSEPEKVAKKFLKYILGLNRSATSLAVLGESGHFPFLVQGFISVLKFWHRISNMNANTLVNKALLTQMNETTQSEWLKTIHFLLKYLGMERCVQQVKEISFSQFQRECKTKLKEKIISEWGEQLKKQNSKLELYKEIKGKFEIESYLDNIPNYHLRKLITKFRCSDHKLEIETGRHKNTERKQRICKTCHLDVENETHFLCFCPTYKSLRTAIFGADNLSMERGREILACKEKAVALKLAKYLQKAFKTREIIMKNL